MLGDVRLPKTRRLHQLPDGDLITVDYRLEKDRENGDERIGTGACYSLPRP
ncbi:hypothetical protein N9183_00565 [bacterium]|nr:hypothetical protein [Akkermansiaceae bacterium]MDB4382557.1 hypothetical protein [Akkermansiaceae bacterium]MDB4526690.1 hypothetical protein [bacterium]